MEEVREEDQEQQGTEEESTEMTKEFANKKNVMFNMKKTDKEEQRVMKFKVLGIGAAGNKAVKALLDAGVVTTEDVVMINSTDKDFPEKYNGTKIILSPDGNGCGKERPLAKEYALKTLKSGQIDKVIPADKEISVLIITSVEGGTGSGSAPIIGEYCRKALGKDIHMVAFTGFEEDIRGMQNTIEFFQELNFDSDIQTIRNASFMKSAGNNKFHAEQLANEEMVRRVRVLLGLDLQASTQNIDNTDIFKVVSSTGYKTIESATFDSDLLDVDNFNKICKSMIFDSKSLKSKNPSQLRLGVILNISPASEDAIDSNFTVIKDNYGIPYETFVHKQYDGKKQYITFISSGMNMPLEEIKAIYDHYEEASKSINDDTDSFFDAVMGMQASNSKYDIARAKGVSVPVNAKEDFFSLYETKTK